MSVPAGSSTAATPTRAVRRRRALPGCALVLAALAGLLLTAPVTPAQAGATASPGLERPDAGNPGCC